MKTVLVLEDDVSLLGLTRLVIEENGYAVLEATSAQEAFRRFEENDAAIDLLIADLTLPTSSGVRVALELCALLPGLRCIITSGFPSVDWNEQDAAAYEELPYDSVVTLQKPFVPATLLGSIHRLIGSPSIAGPAIQAAARS